jgi:hypothetical protein
MKFKIPFTLKCRNENPVIISVEPILQFQIFLSSKFPAEDFPKNLKNYILHKNGSEILLDQNTANEFFKREFKTEILDVGRIKTEIEFSNLSPATKEFLLAMFGS